MLDGSNIRRQSALMTRGYTCHSCQQFHEELPFSYGSPAPDLYYQIPENEREQRVDLTTDQCVIDEKHFFVLGRIEIPVIDADELFAWLAWVSLSEKNFLRMCELWETPGREKEPPYFGWLQTGLPCYGELPESIATNVHTRPVGQRPFIELEPTDHPLAAEQRNGITLARVQQIAEECLHG